MGDSSLALLDSSGVVRLVDAQTVGTEFQQTVAIGNAVTAGLVMDVLPDGSARVGTNVSSTATKSSVTSAIADTLILAANTNRRGFMVYNESTSALRLSFGTVASSATSYSVSVAANALYVGDVPLFTGQIHGNWVTANGAARVTEFTA